MDRLIEPSSLSVAVPENVTESPSVDSDPVDGDEIDTVGGEFAGGISALTVIDTCLESVRPPESVTLAVMVCVPTDRLDNANKSSVAKNSSMLELH